MRWTAAWQGSSSLDGYLSTHHLTEEQVCDLLCLPGAHCCWLTRKLDACQQGCLAEQEEHGCQCVLQGEVTSCCKTCISCYCQDSQNVRYHVQCILLRSDVCVYVLVYCTWPGVAGMHMTEWPVTIIHDKALSYVEAWQKNTPL